MNDHELHQYIKDNYDPPKGESIVLVIKFTPEAQFEELRFKSGDEQQAYLCGTEDNLIYAVLDYFRGVKLYSFHGRSYNGFENLTTGEIYEWSVRRMDSGPADPEKVKEDLQKLISFLMKSQAS